MKTPSITMWNGATVSRQPLERFLGELVTAGGDLIDRIGTGVLPCPRR
jgi:hypothetical protein